VIEPPTNRLPGAASRRGCGCGSWSAR